MSTNFFVTGTDTDVGKTFITALLLRTLSAQGHNVVGLKPIASGFELVDGAWRNADVDQLCAASSCNLPLERVNRYGFKPAIAPHIAAAMEGVELDFGLVSDDVRYARQRADWVLVEGVGGWHVPLSMRNTESEASIAGLASRLGLPVILVVGMRLGCLNHALLTVDAIKASGVRLAGWVANHVTPDFECAAENRETLVARIAAPLLFEVPFASQEADVEVQIRAGMDWVEALRAV
ncbi:ATP-dependent dethiobiotin synthetase BioD [Arenicella chitinivorans]|uniref:ATP-dependent dethiobiotin synthetase BioD n=1 Tax=Arenicella chitinivorans TaxID=1329800 RepID=A0A918VLH6_9GAMM|nr:dethiobiotin synthase [Arenicella chitinivorans]GHA06131.1 ATP-dependent dethiobiotin synthetase BioD [Arenicella chitinivorans]